MKAVLVGIEQVVVTEEQRKDYVEVLHAPYVKGFMEGLQRKLKKLNVGVVPKKGETLCSNLCKLKQKRDMEDRKDLVWYHVVHAVFGMWGNRTALLR